VRGADWEYRISGGRGQGAQPPQMLKLFQLLCSSCLCVMSTVIGVLSTSFCTV